jgi:O-methyltransferase domain
LLSLRFVYYYNIPQYVPANGSISYADIAHASNLDEVLLRRFIQAAMVNRVFSEPQLGYVQHTAISRLLKDDPEAMDTVGFLLEDLAPASTKVIEAYKKWPGSGEPNETGFNIENDTSDPFYLELAKNPERSRRFGGGMRFMTRGTLYDIGHLINGYDWVALDKAGGTVVDIGGGHGGVSRALANATTNLKLIVQDLPGTVKEGESLLPENLKERVTFMPHDFFTEQPVKGADVYFFRFILHNWSDGYCTKILKNLLPALKDGSKVVIYEFLIPEMADTTWSQKQGR